MEWEKGWDQSKDGKWGASRDKKLGGHHDGMIWELRCGME